MLVVTDLGLLICVTDGRSVCIVLSRASLRRMRTFLLAFYVTEEYLQDEVVGVEFEQYLQHAR